MYTLLLVDMHMGMPGPYMARSQCMYQSQAYIDMSMPVICYGYVTIHDEIL